MSPSLQERATGGGEQSGISLSEGRKEGGFVCLDQLSLVEVIASLFPPAALRPALRGEPTAWL